MAESSSAKGVGAKGIGFAIREVWAPPRVWLYLTGELDAAGTDALSRCAQGLRVVRPSAQQVTVDLHDLTFVDLVGLRALTGVCTELAKASSVEVRGLSSSVRRALDLIEGVFPDLHEHRFVH